MSNQLVYKGVYHYGKDDFPQTTKIYTKKGLAVNNTPSGNGSIKNHIIEYELVPTGRKFDKEGNLIERSI